MMGHEAHLIDEAMGDHRPGQLGDAAPVVIFTRVNPR